MFDKDAIEALQLAAAIDQAAGAIQLALSDTRGAAALPEDFRLLDIEPFLLNRRRARGSMATPALPDFAKYVEAHSEPGACVFVSTINMSATAVLNLGSPVAPGHADNIAVYSPPQLAAFKAMGGIDGRASSQQDVAEFLEDWPGFWCSMHEGEAMTIPATIAAVRNITIEALKKADATVGQLSASQSAFEQVKASSGGNKLPTHIYFNCVPYLGFESRQFVLRLAIRTGDKAPALVLRTVNMEQHREEMGNELAAKVTNAMPSTVPVHLGAYTAK